jgi:pimeloyl-ACP methyl ester carboxylesterase
MTHIQKETLNVPVADGTELAADIYHAANQPPCGLLILVPGFAGDKQEGGLFPLLAERAAARGFNCLAYNWRGIAPSTGDFPNSTIEQHAADFMNVTRWAQERLPDSPSGLSVVGFSLGSALVGLALRENHNLQRAVYLGPAPRPNQSMWPRYKDMWDATSDGRTVQKPGSPVLLGRPILASLRDTDLGPNAFNIGVPLLVGHGTADERISCEHSQALAGQVGPNQDFTYIEFVGASHSFRPDGQRLRVANTVVDWLSERVALTQND